MEILDALVYMLNEMSPYVLLGFLIAGVMHAFISRATMSRHLSGSGTKAVLKAAMIGVPLPLCSCGVLPTAVAMRRAGASRAASASFLVATPQTGVDSIAATWSLLGPAFALLRPVAALLTAFGCGITVGKNEQPDAQNPPSCSIPDSQATSDPTTHRTFIHKLKEALHYGFIDLVGSIGGWLVAGLIIAALITVYVPEDMLAALGDRPLLAMIAVVIIAVPMYVCATGSIPIAMSLMLKGLSPGTALVLLMAGPAANFASFTLITREMGRRTAFIYLAWIIAGAIGFGLMIDYLLPSQWFILPLSKHATHGIHGANIFSTICSVILIALLIYTFVKSRHHTHTTITDMTTRYIIKGMNCPHCQNSVAKSIQAVNGVTQVDVNLSKGIATVEGDHNPDDVLKAVREAGFDASLTNA